MNTETKIFIEKLKKDQNILGVILFGSWARKNNRPDSDVDLLVIQKQGFKRVVETSKSQYFEIIYTTAKGALDYWKTDTNGCYGLWAVAAVLFDKDRTIAKLKKQAIKEIISPGKPRIDSNQIEQYHFDALDQLRYVRHTLNTDQTTALMILNNKVFDLAKLFFDLRQLWTPAPKQRLAEISKIDSVAYDHFTDFYTSEAGILEKISVVEKIIKSVFYTNETK